MNKYEFELDLYSQNSTSLIIDMVKPETKVLEFGPAFGRMTKYLKEFKHCTMHIVEIDEKAGKEASNYAEKSCIGSINGDINQGQWLSLLENEKYDYIIFEDVLEHLLWPEEVLKKCSRFLKENGSILISVPNLAHTAVIINLINNEFQYNPTGILDNTHLRFFTYKSLKNMIHKAGYQTVSEKATFCKAEETELGASYNKVDRATARYLRKKDFGDVYQFIFELKKREDFYKEQFLQDIRLDETSRYWFTLYFTENTSKELTENMKLEKPLSPNNINESFHFSYEQGIRAIRFDPLNANCIVKLKTLEIKNDGHIIDLKNHIKSNGQIIHEDIYIFSSDDPQIFFEFNESLFDFDLKLELEFLDYDTDSILIMENSILELMNQEIVFLNNTMEKNLAKNQLELNNYKQQYQEIFELYDEKANELVNLQNELILYHNHYADLVNDYKKLEIQLKDYNNLVNQLDGLKVILAQTQTMYEVIVSSTCWKMTKPVRVFLDFIKKKVYKNKYSVIFYKGLRSLKNDGIRYTMLKTKAWLITNRKKKQNVIFPKNLFSNNIINYNEINPLLNFNKSIAVHVHLFYLDLLDEFFYYLNNIPFDFDIFVSTSEDKNIELIKSKFEKLKHVKKIEVKTTINRGRDIAPLYVQFAGNIKKYDYFLHIHTKKSLFTGKEQSDWRNYSLNTLLENEECVRKIFSLFENSNEKIGLIFPETVTGMSVITHNWLANVEIGKMLLKSMNIEFDDGLFNYPVGSFFWARTSAVMPLFDRKFKYEDFPEENGQNDGTLAHALERVISFVVKAEDYQLGIYDKENEIFSIGQSKKLYQQYFSTNIGDMQQYLDQFEVISFDIFDTLITRKVFLPDDVFHFMSRKIKIQYKIDIDFLNLRKRAEAIAYSKRKKYCSIDDIYQEMKSIWNVPNDTIEKIKQMEIDTELEMCIPRKDVLKIFNYLKNNGKKIILVSDMYLTSDIVIKLLKKCGYYGFSDLWISCEKGARKDDDSMWELFFKTYGSYNTVHVGDNARSDIQMVLDRRKNHFYIMNPVTSFKLSTHYNELKKYINSTVENSLMLGLLINEKLFNSPFSKDKEGDPIYVEPEIFGYCAFGPLFFNFIKWIDEKSQHEDKLLFLSREGYLLKKIYDRYCEILDKTNKSIYFLASRRACSVAAIQEDDDIKEIISQYYRGSLSNLLFERLGMKLDENIEDIEISMAEDLNKVFKLLEPYKKEIFERAKIERINYLTYVESNCNKDEKIAVIDVGYSGTIQYYLMKLLNLNINGYYLVTSKDKKPNRIGGECFSLYQFIDKKKNNVSRIFELQLFLEAVLQAPFGQLICFNKMDGECFADYKEEKTVNVDITKIQEGIIEFTSDYLNLIKLLNEDLVLDKDLAEDIFDIFIRGNWFSKDLEGVFTVQDNYCSNSNLLYNINEKKWK